MVGRKRYYPCGIQTEVRLLLRLKWQRRSKRRWLDEAVWVSPQRMSGTLAFAGRVLA